MRRCFRALANPGVRMRPQAGSGLAAGGFGCEFGASSQTEFGEHVGEVGLDGAATDEKLFRDVVVREAFGDESDDLQLGGCEAIPADGGASPLAPSASWRIRQRRRG